MSEQNPRTKPRQNPEHEQNHLQGHQRTKPPEHNPLKGVMFWGGLCVRAAMSLSSVRSLGKGRAGKSFFRQSDLVRLQAGANGVTNQGRQSSASRLKSQ